MRIQLKVSCPVIRLQDYQFELIRPLMWEGDHFNPLCQRIPRTSEWMIRFICNEDAEAIRDLLIEAGKWYRPDCAWKYFTKGH